MRIDKILNHVLIFYDTPTRYYHNVKHIQDMFQKSKYFKSRLTAAESIAIAYHDVVYDSKNSTGANESASIQLLKNHYIVYFKDFVKLQDMYTACDIIKDTILHVPSSEKSFRVLDLDMSILGETDYIYFNFYLPNIRKEYAHVSDDDFALGRTKFIEKQLNKKSIFNTDEFISMFEFQAIQNLRKELMSYK